MVWCGPPSKACAHCRKRRIKCDLKRPACGQCVRAQKDCPGYRNEIDTLFVDQSKDVVQKLKTKSGSGRAPHVLTTGKKPSAREKQLQLMVASKGLPTEVIGPAVSPPMRDQAFCWLLSNYGPDPRGLGKNIYNYLPHFEDDISSQDSLLGSIVSAVGLAGIAGSKFAPQLMTKAQMHYEQALYRMRMAIQDPVAVKADQTLISVLLFGIYEINTCVSSISLRAWVNHISGAAALLQFRGPQILQSDLGVSLFNQLRVQIIVLCMQTQTRFPQEFLNIAKDYIVNSNDPYDVTLNKMTEISSSICDIRAQQAEGRDGSNAHSILRGALAISDKIDEWLTSLPTYFMPSLKCIEENTVDTLPSYEHTFNSTPGAIVHNNCLLFKLLLHEAAIDAIIKLKYHSQCRTPPDHITKKCMSCAIQTKNSVATIKSMIEGICRNVRFFLPDLGQGSRNEASSKTMWTTAMSTNSLLWPLYCAGSCQYCPPAARAFIIGQLQKITDRSGAQQGRTLATMISEQEEFATVIKPGDGNAGEIEGLREGGKDLDGM